MKFSIFLALALASTALAAPVTIYRGGNASKPVTKLRPGDMTPEKTDPVPNPIPNQQGTPGSCGVSCSTDPNKVGTGKKWQIDSNDVNNSKDFTVTKTPNDDDPNHHTIKSNKNMSPTDYQNEVNALPWSKVPKASRREYEYESAMY